MSQGVTTATSPSRSSVQRRPHYLQNAVNIAPPCHISSAYGDPMEDEIIQDIAITFAALDHELLGVLKVVLDNAASGGLSLDPDSQATMQQDREMISGLQSQFGDIRAGKHGFCRQYLQEGFMLTIWARAGGALSQMLDVDPEDQSNNRLLESVDNMFRILQRAAEPLSDRIPRAAAQGVLEAEDRAGIRLRMLKLDELFDMYHRKKSTLRTLKAWPEIRDLIDAVNPSGTSHPSKVRRPSSYRSTTSIFWATVAVTIGITLPTLYQAYKCSPHSPGTTKDADFWLLIQSSSMQTLGLVAAAISTFKDPYFSAYGRGWMLTMLGLGFCCVVGAVVLYTVVPTEWSALINCTGGALQAFVVVQALTEKKEKSS